MARIEGLKMSLLVVAGTGEISNLELYREFVNEGRRYYDLIRWTLAEKVLN